MSQIIVDYTALEELSRTLLGIKAGLDGISTTATEAGTYLGAANVAEAVAAFGGNWNRAREQISTMLAQVAGAAHAAGLEYQRLEDSLAHSAQSAAGDGGPFDPSGLLPGDLAAATAGAAATVGTSGAGTSTPNAGLPQAEVTTVTIGTAADGTPQAEITTVTLNPDPTTGATDPGTTTTGSTGVDPGATGITAPTVADPTGGSATAIDPTGAGSLAGAGATDPTAATAGSGTAGDPGGGSAGGGSAGGAPLGGGGGGLGSGGGGLSGGDLGSGAAATDPAAVASAATADPLTGGGSAGVSAAATAQPASGTASAGGHSNLGMVAMAAPVGVLGAAGATAWAIKRRRREEPAGEAEDVE